MKCTLLALASVLIGSTVCAQTLQQGQPAPAALLEQLKSVPVTTLGSQSGRAEPPAPQARAAHHPPAPQALAPGSRHDGIDPAHRNAGRQ